LEAYENRQKRKLQKEKVTFDERKSNKPPLFFLFLIKKYKRREQKKACLL